MSVRIHGWAFSPYVRAVRIAVLEKGIEHQLVELGPQDLSSAFYRTLSPFGRVPIFQHGELRLIETNAILRYIDLAFPGIALQPETAADRGEADMLMLTATNYFYPSGVMGVFLQEVYIPENGGQTNAAAVEAAMTGAKTYLDFVSGRFRGPFILGSDLTLADIFIATLVDNFAMSSSGRAALGQYPQIETWHKRMCERPALLQTKVPVPRFGL